MSQKNIDSSPISILEDIFNVKQLPKNYKNNDISLLTEIHEQKVIMDFQWIDDLKVLISSFSIDNYEYSFLTNHMNKINNNLVIGTLKQNNNNKIIYRHSLPISGKVTTEIIRSYLENILSEFNHLVSVLLKGDKVVETTQILINQNGESLIDETSERIVNLRNDYNGHPEGHTYLLDYDSDGDLDIFDFQANVRNGISQWNTNAPTQEDQTYPYWKNGGVLFIKLTKEFSRFLKFL